jgi:hypothetical protein
MTTRRFPAGVFPASLALAIVLAASAAPGTALAQSQPLSLTEAPASINFPAESTSSADTQCDATADSPSDPRRVGAGIPLDQIDTARALASCQAAAENSGPARPRSARAEKI